MKTMFREKPQYAYQLLDCAKEEPCHSRVRPERFLEKMQMNQGSIGLLSGFGLDDQGMERKNPVIAALGDSVTAGHFEAIASSTEWVEDFRQREDFVKALGPGKVEEAFRQGRISALPPVEVTDSRECYLEKFRLLLIEQYERTSVSVINGGIAGDHLLSMIARADRDVVRYQPDLVLINGVLNWGPILGTTGEYKEHLRNLVRKIRRDTQADIILLTPNGDLPNPTFPKPPEGERTLDRVQAVRQIACEERVCLADVYAVWEQARRKGCPWDELLANGINHPGIVGHWVYAITLMKLCQSPTKSIELDTWEKYVEV